MEKSKRLVHSLFKFLPNFEKYKEVSPCFFWIFGQNLKKCKGVSPSFFLNFGSFLFMLFFEFFIKGLAIFAQNLENAKEQVHAFFCIFGLNSENCKVKGLGYVIFEFLVIGGNSCNILTFSFSYASLNKTVNINYIYIKNILLSVFLIPTWKDGVSIWWRHQKYTTLSLLKDVSPLL